MDTAFNVFNSYHQKLNFTFEIENNNRFNFLHIPPINSKNKLISDWYHKPTCTFRTLNFHSNHPIQLKKNIIYKLIERGIKLSDKKFH